MADPDWDSLIRQPGSTTPNRPDDWESLIVPHSPASELTGGNFPRNETPEARARRLAADQRWQNARPHERVAAGVGHLISGVPGVRHLPGVRDIRTNQLVRDYMLARGDEAAFSEIAGNTIPYVGLAGRYPQLFSRLTPSFRSGQRTPGAMLTGATLEGGDAAAGNLLGTSDNSAILEAIRGAAGVVPGAMLGRAITPRHPLTALQNRVQRERERIWPAATPDNPNPRFRTTPLDRAPPRQLPPDTTSNLNNYLTWSALGGLGGYNIYDQPTDPDQPRGPGWGTASGVIAGLLGARYARPISERVVRGANRILATRPMHAAEHALHRYSNNMLLSPGNQALLNALSLGGTAGLADIPPIDPTRNLMGR